MNSIEIRWFVKEQLAKEKISKWFHQLGGSFPPETRTDFYFPETCNGTIGIKARVGEKTLFEVKGLIETSDDLISNTPLGKIERWNKWSTPRINPDILQMIKNGTAKWIAMEKTRTLLKMKINASGTMKPSLEKQVDDGCNIEITEINCLDQRFWSIGYEAFSTNIDLVSNFMKVVNATISKEVTQWLRPDEAYSYPKLIEKIKFDQTKVIGSRNN